MRTIRAGNPPYQFFGYSHINIQKQSISNENIKNYSWKSMMTHLHDEKVKDYKNPKSLEGSINQIQNINYVHKQTCRMIFASQVTRSTSI